MTLHHSGWTLVRPTTRQATLVASWVRSARGSGTWCAGAHPFPATAITAWWGAEGLQPWLLLDAAGIPVGYGELWIDEEDDESELLRLVVDPSRRREGIGRRLVDELVALARAERCDACLVRITPDDLPSLALCRAAGFEDLDDVTSASWNDDLAVSYRWLVHPAFVPALAC